MRNVINKEYMPRRSTVKSAGYDIFVNEPVTLCPGEFKTLDTGIIFEDSDLMFHVSGNIKRIKGKAKNVAEIRNPVEYVGLIFPRSSYGFKYGLRFANSVCVIDQDYRDTIKLSITVDKEVTLNKGDRIAQMIFIPWLILRNEIPPNDKRDGGIGSTGN